jgi:arabinan endo-1,5-alpha-L-arabinosidase
MRGLLVRLGLLLLALAGGRCFAQAPATVPARFGSRGIRVHDPSTIVKWKHEYWVFYTGRGIPSWHSRDLTRWEEGPRVFNQPPAWVAEAVPGNRGFFWAPDILRLKDRFLLYYSVSTFGRNTSVIGLAANSTLDPADSNYHWTDCGLVVQSRSDDAFNAIDPAVSLDAEGRLWLAFGSFWSGIKLVELDPATGKRIQPDSPIHSLAYSSAIEAPCISLHDGYYYLFVNWGVCCRGTNSTYNLRVGRSRAITGPYVDREDVSLLTGGGSLLLDSDGPFIGPGHAGILSEGGTNWFSCHFYDGTRQGAPTLALLGLRWATNGWPQLNAQSQGQPRGEEKR